MMFGLFNKESRFENIDNATFTEGAKAENAVILDVRTPLEFNEGHIPNALALDIKNPAIFVSGIQDLDQDKTYYIYCRSGARSATACAHMADLGFDKLYNLKDGILGWDGPVEK